jgi:hypothetical protein
VLVNEMTLGHLPAEDLEPTLHAELSSTWTITRVQMIAKWPTKGCGSSWIFEPHLTCANALRRVQHPAFSLVSRATYYVD